MLSLCGPITNDMKTEMRFLIRLMVCLLFVPLGLPATSGPVGNPLVEARECPLIVTIRNQEIAKSEILGRDAYDRVCNFRVYFEAKVSGVNKTILDGQSFKAGDTIHFYRHFGSHGLPEDGDFDAFLFEDQRVVFLRLDETGAWFSHASYSQEEAIRFPYLGLYHLVDIDGKEQRWTIQELQELSYDERYPFVRTPHDVIWPRTIETAEATVLKSLKGGRELRRLQYSVEDPENGFGWLDLRMIGLCKHCSRSGANHGFTNANQDLCRVFGRVSPAHAKHLFSLRLRERLREERTPQEKLDWKKLERLDSIQTGSLQFVGVSPAECAAVINEIIYSHDPSFGEKFWDVGNDRLEINLSLRNCSVRQVIQFVTEQVDGFNCLKPRKTADDAFHLEFEKWQY